MKNKIAVIFLFFLVIMSIHVSAAPDCYLNAPGRGEPVCGAGFTQRGLVSIHGHFTDNTSSLAPYSLCCSDFFVRDAGENTFKFAEIPDAPPGGHTGSPASGLTGEVWIGSKQCAYRAGGCVGDEACIFNVSDEFGTDDNDHIGDCNDNTLPVNHTFGLSLCCQIAEKCADGIDNDGDGYIDCADEECNQLPDPVHGVFPQICDPGSQTHLQNTLYCSNGSLDSDGIPMYNSSGHLVDGENENCRAPPAPAGDGQIYYCGYQLSDDPGIDPVGVCCPNGLHPQNVSGIWVCFESNQCGVGVTRDCRYDFDTNRNDWYMSVYNHSNSTNWCNSQIHDLYAPTLEPYAGSTGCCLIPKYGRIDYWLDENNVKIYGVAP